MNKMSIAAEILKELEDIIDKATYPQLDTLVRELIRLHVKCLHLGIEKEKPDEQ